MVFEKENLKLLMKNLLLLASFIFCTLSGMAQEFDSPNSIFIGNREAAPSLSLLTPDFPESRLTLTEVNFNKIEKREVNFVGMMERERYHRERSYIELDAPMPALSTGEKALIEVTNNIRIQDRSSNFDIYTGEKKIPAYQEMRVPLFHSPYSGSRVRGYISPYSYSSFLR